MSRHPHFVPQGVIPAVLLPFHKDLSIDEPSFRAHFLRDARRLGRWRAYHRSPNRPPGSSEVASCTDDEQRRVMEIAGEEVGGALPIIHGVYADGSLEAARIARRASGWRRFGAAGAFHQLLFALGQSAAMALAHLRRSAMRLICR